MQTNEYKINLKKLNINAFQQDLINWFKDNQRQLPWRLDQDPYKVWVSEIMLQQTQVDTVIPYFKRFMDQFPTPTELANADQQDVLKAWEGLGYYSRARNLQTAVKEVKEKYGGQVPNQRQQLANLKGIGPYTLGAIMSIAFNQPEPAVDGNVMRVLSRLLEIEDDIAKAKTRKIFELTVRSIISEQEPSYFNQGLMELGALICRPKSPKCEVCPVQKHCQAYVNNSQDRLPVKTKAKKQKVLSYYAIILENQSGRYLIEQRPDTGLLASLWQFPMLERKAIEKELLASFLEQSWQTTITEVNQLEPVRHVFSHVIWELEVYRIKVTDINIQTQSHQWVSLNQLNDYPFPVPHQHIIKQI
ncbi:A/G-specific adenine glycosylase [Amphibacillus cookii]|uniref:A/G-specific adenine glycosylase n=1 Tax=Amphibacillus cookii TaxID=767787 RepID=UPI001958E61C|nr:A/G-specific adenine glycosylase [Amphibacillus cookii]MBM7542151.1 A/G-specific adenine glycosylase [Amphibacillus cookii]